MTPAALKLVAAAGAVPTVSLGDLSFLGSPRGMIGRKIRAVQVGTMAPIMAVTNFSNLLNASLIAATIWSSALRWQLAVWIAAILSMWVIRLLAATVFAKRLFAGSGSAGAVYTYCIVTMSALLWCAPALFWSGAASHDNQMLMAVVMIGMMCGGSIVIAIVPPAAFTYLFIHTAAMVWLALNTGLYVLLPVMATLSITLGATCLWFARQFIAYLRARFELEEHAELIELLREFQASGSGGIWELDTDLTITYISDELAKAIGKPAPTIVGVTVHQLLDPLGRIAELSSGMRALFDNFEKGIAFRDLAVPAFESDRWWSLSGKPVLDPAGQVCGWRGVGSDITALRLEGGDSVNAARTDPLTGLANRLLIRELLEEALHGRLDGEGDCALLLIDLDRFKLVNDTLGHAVGDHLLCEVARRLETAVGKGGCVGRLGGDEFAVVLTRDANQSELSELAARICSEVSKPVSIGASSIHVGATIGIARGTVDAGSQDQLMRSADLALYQAKEQGRGGHAFFEQAMFAAAEDQRLLENDVRDALNDKALSLAYQDIVDAPTGAVVGREVLLRWNHPQRGPISPEIFVPIIEDTGLIHRIGDWVIREACMEATRWNPSTRVAVNVSAIQVSREGLEQTVFGALAASGLRPDRLELEVTETVFLGDNAATMARLERLRALGVRLVLDDFGKGYSSFGYLSTAHFSKIKIDQSFVRGAARGVAESVAIVEAILALARGLGMETTAEGVETEQQANSMRLLGCTQLQGFYFSRPERARSIQCKEPSTRGEPLRRLA
jgi:diguanylate cyclase (GGDEF)-like protein